MFDILTLSSILDIFVVAIGIYLLLIFIKQTRSYFIIYGVIGLTVIGLLSTEFDLGLTRKVIQPLFTFFLVIFVIVFQREIRRFFRWLALSKGSFEKRIAYLDDEVVTYLTDALMGMAERRMGGIVVLSGEYPLDDIIQGGFDLDGKITSALLLSIFDHSTPGHDGAVLIENRRISKFGVHLPLAEEFTGFATMGTRHRASSGITERTDAIALVVSEERGTISIAKGGVLRTLPDRESVEGTLHAFFKDEHAPARSVGERFFSSNHFLKVVSGVMAAVLWFFVVFQANIVTKEIVVPFEFENVPGGLTVAATVPVDMKVTISGDNQDINALKAGDIHAVVNLKDREAGTIRINLSEENIVRPTYVSVTAFSPKSVSVTLKPEEVTP